VCDRCKGVRREQTVSVLLYTLRDGGRRRRVDSRNGDPSVCSVASPHRHHHPMFVQALRQEKTKGCEGRWDGVHFGHIPAFTASARRHIGSFWRVSFRQLLAAASVVWVSETSANFLCWAIFFRNWNSGLLQCGVNGLLLSSSVTFWPPAKRGVGLFDYPRSFVVYNFGRAYICHTITFESQLTYEVRICTFGISPENAGQVCDVEVTGAKMVENSYSRNFRSSTTPVLWNTEPWSLRVSWGFWLWLMEWCVYHLCHVTGSEHA